MPNQHDSAFYRLERSPHVFDVGGEIAEGARVRTRARQLVRDSYPVTGLHQPLGHEVPHPATVERAVD